MKKMLDWATFTLIERLVVVAIISILTSLLLPGLRQARGVAKRAQCQSRLKNFGVAHAQYISDSDGYAVPHTRQYEWEDLLAVYLGYEKYDGHANPINFPGNIFTCSEEPEGRGAGWYPSFAINGVMANDVRLMVKYKLPSSKFFMVDAWKSDYFKWAFYPGEYNHGNVSVRHISDTCNIVFLDGHVKGYGCPPIPRASLGAAADSKWTTPGYPTPDGL